MGKALTTGIVVICAVFYSLIFLVAGSPAAFAVIIVLGLLFYCSRTSLRMVIFWCLFCLVFFGIVGNLFPPLNFLTKLHEIFVVVIFFRIIKAYASDPKKFFYVRPIFGLSFIFVLFSVVSWLYNRSSAVGLFYFLYSYLKFFIIFIAAAILLSEDDINFLMKSILNFIIIQVAIQLVQMGTYGHGRILVGPEINLWEDSACGTFGHYGAHELGHFMLIMFFWTSMCYFTYKTRNWLGWSFVAFTSFFLAFAEQDYIILALFFFCLIFIFKVRSFGYRVGMVVATGLLLLVLSSYGFQPWGRYVELFSNHRKVSSSGKVEGYHTAFKILNQSGDRWVVGTGPGSYCSGAAFKVEGKFFKQYIEWKIKNILSTTDYLWSSFTAILVEVGLLGYAIYFSIFLYIFSILLKGWSYIRRGFGDKNDYAVIFPALFVLGYLFFLSLLSDVLEWSVVIFPAILLCALACKACFRYRSKTNA